MVAYLPGLASSASPEVDDPISGLLTYGPLGLLLVLFVFGLIVAKPTVERLIRDRDDWKAAYEKSEAARTELASALSQANNTAAVALESSQTVAKMLDYLGHSRADRPRDAV